MTKKKKAMLIISIIVTTIAYAYPIPLIYVYKHIQFGNPNLRCVIYASAFALIPIALFLASYIIPQKVRAIKIVMRSVAAFFFAMYICICVIAITGGWVETGFMSWRADW